jgi:protein-S-isoprenylcysteine O-methyltransferase Ste14
LEKKMALREEFEKCGRWMFRWRSYLPLLMVGILIMSLRNFHYLAYSEGMDELWETFCLCVSFFGLGIRIFTIGHTPAGTSGRNTREQVADTLNTTGIYSVVRHPLYLGNFFIWLGIVLFAHQWPLTLICVLSYWLYYERIMFAEEAYLRAKFGIVFEDWADKTPAVIPSFRNWKKADLPFSLRNVLKREYNGFFVIILSMSLLEATGNIFVEGKPEFDMMWSIILSIGFVIWLTLRTLKKKTALLHVEGR